MESRLKKKLEELEGIIREYNEKADFKKVEDAFEFAKIAHIGQKRYSGEPYVIHGLETAKILASWKLDATSIIAGILHDTVEDGAANFQDIKKEFGEDVAYLVDGVTKVSYLKLRGSKEEEFIENLRKMFLAMAKDLRVVLVKLADRLHNMRTLMYVPEDRQRRIAQETLEIYAPLAERLGMGRVSAELLDLAFPYIYPSEYERVKRGGVVTYKKAEENIKKMRRTLLRVLADEGIKAKIDGRKKSFYSLWRKLLRPEISWNFNKIYDVVALRILVDTVTECYTALGVVHKSFKLVPHFGISDFIAQPKPNGYSSIHTRVFGPGGKITEVQIRTYLMHEVAEHGVAAHWAYTETKNSKLAVSDRELDMRGATAPDEILSWVKQLAKWQEEISDSKEFLAAVKFDALSERIFVFSPKGDVFDLPQGATPVDFAYSVHTDLGDFLKAAKADGKIVPLDYKLKSGQVIEILKSKEKRKPSHEWLDFVITNQARREINKNLRKG
jgi:GTP pyrophosphokinase